MLILELDAHRDASVPKTKATKRSIALYRVTLMIVGVCASLVLSGCFAPRPDPFVGRVEQLNSEKNEASAECNQQIDALAAFYGQHEDTIERENKAGTECLKESAGKSPSLCASHFVSSVRAVSELTGHSEPDATSICLTGDTPECANAGKEVGADLGATEACVKQKITTPANGICQIDGLGERCILALDEGALCMPNGPQLPACNRLVKIEGEISQLATAWRENDQRAAQRSLAAAAWAPAIRPATQPQYLPVAPPPPAPPVFTSCTNFGSTTNCITH